MAPRACDVRVMSVQQVVTFSSSAPNPVGLVFVYFSSPLQTGQRASSRFGALLNHPVRNLAALVPQSRSVPSNAFEGGRLDTHRQGRWCYRPTENVSAASGSPLFLLLFLIFLCHRLTMMKAAFICLLPLLSTLPRSKRMQSQS